MGDIPLTNTKRRDTKEHKVTQRLCAQILGELGALAVPMLVFYLRGNGFDDLYHVC